MPGITNQYLFPVQYHWPSPTPLLPLLYQIIKISKHKYSAYSLVWAKYFSISLNILSNWRFKN